MNSFRAMIDILWFRDNTHRYNDISTATFKRIDSIINNLIDCHDSPLYCWQALYDIFGPDTYNRNCNILYDNLKKREMDNILQQLTTADKENLTACKYLLASLVTYAEASIYPREVWDVLNKVIDDKVQPVLALGDLVDRFPSLFCKPKVN